MDEDILRGQITGEAGGRAPDVDLPADNGVPFNRASTRAAASGEDNARSVDQREDWQVEAGKDAAQRARKKPRAEPHPAFPHHDGSAAAQEPPCGEHTVDLETEANQSQPLLDNPEPNAQLLPPVYMPAVCQLLLVYLQRAQQATGAKAASKGAAAEPQGVLQGGDTELPILVAVRQLRGFGIPAALLLQAAAHTMVVGALSPAQYQAVQAELGPESLISYEDYPQPAMALAAGYAAPGELAAAMLPVPVGPGSLGLVGGSGAADAAMGAGGDPTDAAAPVNPGAAGPAAPQAAGLGVEGVDAAALPWAGRGGTAAPVRLGLGRRLFSAIADQLPMDTELDSVMPPQHGLSGVLYLVHGGSEVGAALWDGTLLRDLGTYSSSQDARQSVTMTIRLIAATAAAAPAAPRLSVRTHPVVPAGTGTLAAGAASSLPADAAAAAAVPQAAEPAPAPEEADDVVEAAEQLLSLRNLGGRPRSQSPPAQLQRPQPASPKLDERGPQLQAPPQQPQVLSLAPQPQRPQQAPAQAPTQQSELPPQLAHGQVPPHAPPPPAQQQQRPLPSDPLRSLQEAEAQLPAQRRGGQQLQVQPSIAAEQRPDQLQQRQHLLHQQQQQQALRAAAQSRRISSDSLTATSAMGLFLPFSAPLRGGAPSQSRGTAGAVASLAPSGPGSASTPNVSPSAVATVVPLPSGDERTGMQLGVPPGATASGPAGGPSQGAARDRGEAHAHAARSSSGLPRPLSAPGLGRPLEQGMHARPDAVAAGASARGQGDAAAGGRVRASGSDTAHLEAAPGSATVPGVTAASAGDATSGQSGGLEGQLLLELLQHQLQQQHQQQQQQQQRQQQQQLLQAQQQQQQRSVGAAAQPPPPQFLDRELLAGLLASNRAASPALLGAVQQLLQGRAAVAAAAAQHAGSAPAMPGHVDTAELVPLASLPPGGAAAALLGGGIQLAPHLLAALQARAAGGGQHALEAAQRDAQREQRRPPTRLEQQQEQRQQQQWVLQLDRQRSRAQGNSQVLKQGQGSEDDPAAPAGRALRQPRDMDAGGLPPARGLLPPQQLQQQPQQQQRGRPPPPQWLGSRPGQDEGGGGDGGGSHRAVAAAQASLRDEAAYASALESLVASGRLAVPPHQLQHLQQQLQQERGAASQAALRAALSQELMQLGGVVSLPEGMGGAALVAQPPRGGLMLGPPLDPGAAGSAGAAVPLLLRRPYQFIPGAPDMDSAGAGGAGPMQLTPPQPGAPGGSFDARGERGQSRDSMLENRRYGRYPGGGTDGKGGTGGPGGGGYGTFSAAGALAPSGSQASGLGGRYPLGSCGGQDGGTQAAEASSLGQGRSSAWFLSPLLNVSMSVPPADGGASREDSGTSSGALLLGEPASGGAHAEVGSHRGVRRRKHEAGFQGA